MIDILTAFLLGLGVIIHPCTAAPNIAAMTFIGDRGKKTALALAMYVVGHTLAYVMLGSVLVMLASGTHVQRFLSENSRWGHNFLILLFLIAGVWLIGSSFRNHHHEQQQHNVLTTPCGAFFSGMGVAFLFCPEAAFAFFGVLIPMALASEWGLLSIVVFSFATCIPLMMLAWILKTGKHQMLTRFNLSRTLLNRIIGVMFIIAAVVMMVL